MFCFLLNSILVLFILEFFFYFVLYYSIIFQYSRSPHCHSHSRQVFRIRRFHCACLFLHIPNTKYLKIEIEMWRLQTWDICQVAAATVHNLSMGAWMFCYSPVPSPWGQRVEQRVVGKGMVFYDPVGFKEVTAAGNILSRWKRSITPLPHRLEPSVSARLVLKFMNFNMYYCYCVTLLCTTV